MLSSFSSPSALESWRRAYAEENKAECDIKRSAFKDKLVRARQKSEEKEEGN